MSVEPDQKMMFLQQAPLGGFNGKVDRRVNLKGKESCFWTQSCMNPALG